MSDIEPRTADYDRQVVDALEALQPGEWQIEIVPRRKGGTLMAREAAHSFVLAETVISIWPRSGKD